MTLPQTAKNYPVQSGQMLGLILLVLLVSVHVAAELFKLAYFASSCTYLGMAAPAALTSPPAESAEKQPALHKAARKDPPIEASDNADMVWRHQKLHRHQSCEQCL